MATRPHPPQTNFMAESLSLHTCLASVAGAPQKLHLVLSPQGLHRCPGSLATAPQVLHVYAIVDLLVVLNRTGMSARVRALLLGGNLRLNGAMSSDGTRKGRQRLIVPPADSCRPGTRGWMI